MANRIMFLDIEAGSEPLERAVMARRRGAQDGGKLAGAVHGEERVPLQGVYLPPTSRTPSGSEASPSTAASSNPRTSG